MFTQRHGDNQHSSRSREMRWTNLQLVYQLQISVMGRNTFWGSRGQNKLHISETGRWVQPGNRFVSFRSRVRAVWWPSGIGSQNRVPTFSLFLFGAPSFPFPRVWAMYKVYKVYEVSEVYKLQKCVEMYKVNTKLLPPPPKPPIQL